MRTDVPSSATGIFSCLTLGVLIMSNRSGNISVSPMLNQPSNINSYESFKGINVGDYCQYDEFDAEVVGFDTNCDLVHVEFVNDHGDLDWRCIHAYRFSC